MILLKNVITHLVIVIFTVFILTGTLFISRPVNFPERKVNLGYPISFYTLDFSSTNTSMGGAPESYLKSRKFNAISSWEQSSQWNWQSYMISFTTIFFVFEIIYQIFNIIKRRSG